MLTGAANNSHEFLLAGIERGFVQLRGHAQHAVERGADFVAHVGQEALAGRHGSLGCFFGPLHGPLGLNASGDVLAVADDVGGLSGLAHAVAMVEHVAALAARRAHGQHPLVLALLPDGDQIGIDGGVVLGWNARVQVLAQHPGFGQAHEVGHGRVHRKQVALWVVGANQGRGEAQQVGQLLFAAGQRLLSLLLGGDVGQVHVHVALGGEGQHGRREVLLGHGQTQAPGQAVGQGFGGQGLSFGADAGLLGGGQRGVEGVGGGVGIEQLANGTEPENRVGISGRDAGQIPQGGRGLVAGAGIAQAHQGSAGAGCFVGPGRHGHEVALQHPAIAQRNEVGKHRLPARAQLLDAGPEAGGVGGVGLQGVEQGRVELPHPARHRAGQPPQGQQRLVNQQNQAVGIGEQGALAQ